MKLIDTECRFKPQGCPQTMPLHAKRSHEVNCPFNIALLCPFMYLYEEGLEPCNDEVTTKTILTHFTDCHHVPIRSFSRISLRFDTSGFVFPMKFDSIFKGAEETYYVMVLFEEGCSIMVVLLDNKKTQRVVTVALKQENDVLVMSRPTYGLQADNLSKACFELTADEVFHFDHPLSLDISVTASGN